MINEANLHWKIVKKEDIFNGAPRLRSVYRGLWLVYLWDMVGASRLRSMYKCRKENYKGNRAQARLKLN